MTAETHPKFVYKILPSAPPSPFPKENPLSELDKKDGFIHLSTGIQVPATSALFFDSASSLWVAKLRFADFASDIKWEGGFPHLYGNFGSDNVDSVHQFDKVEGQNWAEVLEHSTWLEE
ncbi:hypothetical protein B0T10DRAFT_554467 [Thelonectria olida]|uniref:DUF952 domain-containing protein n=1 Tax=Thelonectria olida TaxID=1576542 RepID=A0A9P9AZ46_9HYPO|nr:hypothetical protein B0T10DRAFT_554467 [Thelonectria olida]